MIAAPYAVSNDAGNQTLALLREWALSVAAGSQLAVHGGLDAIANNLTYVLGILVFGAAYALSEGLTTFLRQWRRHKPLDLGLRLNAADAAGPVSLASVSAPIGASALPS